MCSFTLLTFHDVLRLQLVLVLGDLHIPHRKDELPAPFKSLLTPGRFHHVLCTGNTTNRHTTDWVRSLAPTAHFARGDLDTEFSQLDHRTNHHTILAPSAASNILRTG